MTPVPESLLNLLKLLLLILIYLFFLRVLRAVWAEVNGPRVVRSEPAPRRSSRRSRRDRHTALVVTDPPEQRGRSFELSDELTIGRAAGCQITVEDSYVSQIHARVFNADGQVMVEDLGSTNGTYLNKRKVTRATAVNPGDKLQIGNTVLELS